MINIPIGIIGVGFVGGAIFKSFKEKHIHVVAYDKYKQDDPDLVGSLEECLKTKLLFLCLPTQYSIEKADYDLVPIQETMSLLNEKNYKGLIIIKSTVTPQTTTSFNELYPELNICHNPEFLKANNAFNDFHNQDHIVIGSSKKCEGIDLLYIFYNQYYPEASISKCSSDESESVKLFINSFYASKIQLFNEYYMLCEKININYDHIKEIMFKNKRINVCDTNVPGPDGQLSYGGACFPKDTNALSMFMERKGTLNHVIKAVIKERNEIRPHILE